MQANTVRTWSCRTSDESDCAPVVSDQVPIVTVVTVSVGRWVPSYRTSRDPPEIDFYKLRHDKNGPVVAPQAPLVAYGVLTPLVAPLVAFAYDLTVSCA